MRYRRQPISGTPFRWHCLLAGLGCWFALPVTAVHAQQTPEERLRQGLTSLTQGLNQQAADVLAQVVADHPESAVAGRAMCGAGQALVRLGRYAEALDFFEAAIARNDTSLRRLPLEIAAAVAAESAGLPEHVIAHCEAALQQADARTAASAIYLPLIRALTTTGQSVQAWQRIQEAAGLEEVKEEDLLELALALGMAALSANEHAVAMAALRWYLDHSSHIQDSPAAAEGLAWAKALTAGQPADAAIALESFAASHPQAETAAQALVAAAVYRIQADEKALAAKNLEEIQHAYPEANWRPDQWATIADAAQVAGLTELAKEARQHSLHQADMSKSSPRIAAEALIEAARKHDAALWTGALGVLSKSNDPVAVTRALSGLAEAGLAAALADAAHELISGDQQPSSEVRLAVIQFLAASGKWALLAEEAVSLSQLANLEPVAARWIFESLHQTGETQAAYDWGKRVLASQEYATDADFLLRFAEVAVQAASREDALQIVAQASRGITTGIRQARLEILRAELDIRAAAFDSARQRLEQVARKVHGDGDYSARAQWLIGETFFMQGNMEAAINAYRQVQSHAKSEPYQPLAQVQAGKCFERLGRLRDAAVCYSAALSQTVDPQAARVAQSRLQSLPASEVQRR